jgi:ankyrin repeat protein
MGLKVAGPLSVVFATVILSGCLGDSSWNRQRLLKAACEGNVSRVRSLLDHGVSPDARDEDDWTALACAAQVCSKEVVELLLQRGASTNISRRYGEPLSVIAGQTRDGKWCKDGPAIAELLLAAGANVHGKSPCATLRSATTAEAMEFLLAHGADVRRCVGIDTPIYGLTDHPGALGAYLRGGGDPNQANSAGITALHYIAENANSLDKDSLSGMRVLLEHKADPDARDRLGYTPLDYAHRRNFKEAYDLLREFGGRTGDSLPQDAEVAAARAVRAANVLRAATSDSSGVCTFDLVGENMNTGGSGRNWAVIQGTTATVHANCRETGLLHYAVLLPSNKTIPMQLNMFAMSGASAHPIEFTEEWRNAGMAWFFSKESVDDLAVAVEQKKAQAVTMIDITVAPLRGGRKVRAGRLSQ